jgi:acetoacetate decarboxylase
MAALGVGIDERPARVAKISYGDVTSRGTAPDRVTKTQVNLKFIPGVDGRAEICKLVAYNPTDVVVKGSWIGPGRLHLVPHVNAPVADFPVRRLVGAHHFLADLTLPLWRRPARLSSKRRNRTPPVHPVH